MTIFAVACAGHLSRCSTPAGRGSPTGCSPTRTRWACGRNFRSPLIWDVFAVSTYATVSLLFWYVGLIPDLATLRDRAKKLWAQDPLRHARDGLARLGAALAPLRDGLAAARRPRDAARRLGPHGRVASTSPSGIVPGWHATIFPPYFVAGAIYAGFAMVLTLAIPLRKIYGLEDFITMKHLDNMAKILLATGLDRRLRLRDRGVHGLLQRQHLRALHDVEPHARARTSTCTGR